MPIRVDHADRRAELVDAVWRIVARDGVTAASVRGVAQESGMSVGSIRHFFSTQNELLRFAVTELVERVRRRVEFGTADRAAALDEERPIEAAVALLEKILPLDDQRLLEARVWAAFTAPPVTDTEMAVLRNYADEGVRDLCHGALTIGEAGVLHPYRDMEVEIERLHALVDGLTVHLLHEPTGFAPERVRSILLTHLKDLRHAPAAERRSLSGEARTHAERPRDEDPSTERNPW